MNTFEMLVTISLVFNFITLYLVFRVYNSTERQNIFWEGLRQQLPAFLSNINENIGVLNNNFVEFTGAAENMLDEIQGLAQFVAHTSHSQGSIFRTKDGKYTAASLDELIEKIKHDEEKENEEENSWSDDIKRLFEDDQED